MTYTSPTLNEQLVEVVTSLERRGIGYWLNSGSLLGMVREGTLLEHDGDIDIDVWWTDDEKVAEWANGLDRRRYNIRRRLYKGDVIKYSIVPHMNASERSIDVDVYRVHGGFAWCPQYIPKMQVPYVWRLPDLLLRACGDDIGNPLFGSVFHRLYTWWIPAHFFVRTEVLTIAGVDFRIPSKPADYLTFRYNNWEEPVKDWRFDRDDAGLVAKHPRELLK